MARRRTSRSDVLGFFWLIVIAVVVATVRLVVHVLTSLSGLTYLLLFAIVGAALGGSWYLKQRALQRRRTAHEAATKALFDADLAYVQQVWRDNAGLVKTFCEITERKISVLDEYGDESWDRLPKLVEDCLAKIAGRSGTTPEQIREWLKARDRDPRARIPAVAAEPGARRRYLALAELLEDQFKTYHAERRESALTAPDLNDLTGQEFEMHIARVLKHLGFRDVRGTPATGDQGADLIASKDRRVHVIQAKRYTGSVGNAAVQEVVAALRFYGGDEAWVVTNSTFTKAAIALARVNSVRLVDGNQLKALEEQASLLLQD